MKKNGSNASDVAARYPLHVRWRSIPGLINDCCHADSPELVLVQLKDIAEDLVTDLKSFDQNNRQ